jgi:endonuclease YncB( thermonuclease family)
VRIFNIDAPEIDGQCTYESELAQQAKHRLAEIMEGRRVELFRQGNDRYGRTLAVIQVDGADVGDQLVREGLARTWSGRREAWC